MKTLFENSTRQRCLVEEAHPPKERTELSDLISVWESEGDPVLKEKLKNLIISRIEAKEREAFIARFKLKDFGSWNNVLTDAEGSVANAHKANFYEPYLILTLHEHNGCLPAIQAIEKTIDKIKDKLVLADYKLTASKRFRYDTTIRFLADDLKKRAILSSDKEHKNKLWVLTKTGRKEAEKIKVRSHEL